MNTHPVLAKGFGAIAIAALFLIGSTRKKRNISRLLGVSLTLVFAVAGGVMIGCGGSPHTATSTSTAVTNQLSVSSSSPAYGAAVTLTSTLSPVLNTSTLSGTVLFYDGATLLGSASVSGGKAQLTLSTLPVGKHSITASYSGDGTFMPSTSTVASIDVTLATTLSITVSDTAGNTAQLALPVSIH